MGDLVQDIRYAARSLRRTPLFSGVALVTLGAAMTLTLAVFAVVDCVLLRPLAYPEPSGLVLIQGSPAARYGVSMPMHVLVRDESNLLESAAAWQGWAPVREDPNGAPARAAAASVSASYFEVVGGFAPARGRLFATEDGAPGHEPAVVLAHGFWIRMFGGDPGIVDRLVELDGEPYRIVGVAPEGFVDPVARGLGLTARELWRVEPPSFREAEQDPGWIGFWSLGRLRPGARAEALTTEMRSILTSAHAASGTDEQAREYRAVTVRDAVVEDIRGSLVVLMAAVLAVLLIACTNLANLLLSRATARRGEMAIRDSLGAGRGRLVRQLLTESVVLAAAGTALGLLVATAVIPVLVNMAGASLPRADEVRVSGAVLFAAAGGALGVAVMFGLVPALRTSAQSGALVLREAGWSALGNLRGRRMRVGLVVLEMALAVVLLSGAGLLVRTLVRLEAVDPGFDAGRVLVVGVGLGADAFPDPALQEAALGEAERALARLQGVTAVGAITDLPLSGAVNSTLIRLAGQTDEAAGGRSTALVRAVTPAYFSAMGIEIVAGRPLLVEDRGGDEEVALVNQELVRRSFGGSALGQVVEVRGVQRRIVGVVADVREFDLTSVGADPVLYTPYAQEREGWMKSSVNIVARTTGEPADLAGPARAAVQTAHARIAVGSVQPLEVLMEAHLRAPRFRTVLLLVFAVLAALLAGVGLGGVVAYGVSQRVPEIGLRLALGARTREVQTMILRETAIMIGAGLAFGIGLTLASGLPVSSNSVIFYLAEVFLTS